LCFRVADDRFRECGSIGASGHNPPVGVTFQLLLVVRPVIELSGRYSASKLMTSLPQPGQIQPFCVQKTLPFRRPDHVTLLPFK
jgi:hypothetical protein